MCWLYRLRSSGLTVRFCSNETEITQNTLIERLRCLGFDLVLEELHTPAPACRQLLQENRLRPYLLGEPLMAIREECNKVRVVYVLWLLYVAGAHLQGYKTQALCI